MKKNPLCLIAILLAVLAFQASAQMRWGVSAGMVHSKLKWNQEYLRTSKFETDPSVAYFAGIFGEYSIPGIGFAVDLGLQYAQRGATMHLGDFKIWQADGYGNERSYLHYIDIPIHLRFKYSNLNGFERKLAPFIFAGPSVSILVAHNDIPAFEHNPIELGIEVGGGVEIFRNYQLSVSYNWGVTNTMSATKLQSFNAKNKTLKVGLTYFF